MRSLHKLTKRYFKYFMVYLLMCCVLFNVPLSVALASPQGHDVKYGNVTVHYGANNTIVNITSNNAIINWQSLNTLPGEVLQFLQRSSSSAVLNRITSALPTQFDGALIANGRVFIVNPAGVIFGESATVNVSQLVVSGLNISNEDFLNGVYRFEGGYGDVINKGNISAEKVALIGKHVLNAGTIISPNGYVIMAAGDKVFLGQPNSNIIVEVGSLATEGIADVVNEGVIEADNGQIILAAGDIFSRAIKNLGTLAARVGTVTASAARVGQLGTVDVDGVEGDGGTVRLTASEVVTLGSESITTANAGENGDGGEVIVFSPEKALFRKGAKIEAKGGAVSGDGGYIDVSGKEYVEVEGSIDLSAANGKSGEFLIDPYNIIIRNDPINWLDADDQLGNMNDGVWDPIGYNSVLDIGILEGYLASGSVIISTEGDGAGLQEGTVTFLAGRDMENITDNSFTVNAEGAIRMAPSSGIDFAGNGSVELNAGDYIEIFEGTNINLQGDGSLTLNAATTASVGGNLTTAGSGDITFTSNVTLNGSTSQSIDAGTGTLTASSTITKTGGNLTLAGDTGINLDGTVTGSGQVTVGNANTTAINIAGDVTGAGVAFAGAVTADGGDQTFDATTGTLLARNTITKTGGDLILVGDVGVDLNGTVTGSGQVTVGNGNTTAINVSGDVTGAGVTFAKAVTADGSGVQVFDATTGTLLAVGITRTGSGDLALVGNSVDLNGAVNVQTPTGNLAIVGLVDAEDSLQATRNITIHNDAAIAGDVTAVNGTIDLRGTVDADGGDQTFDAGTGTLWAKKTIIKTETGKLTLGGATAINLDGMVDVQDGSLLVDDAVDAGDNLQATMTVTIMNDADIAGDVTAVNGMIDLRGTVNADGSTTQTFNASATLIANGSITKTGDGGLNLTSTTSYLYGEVGVQTAGDLVITGSVFAQGNLRANGGVTVNSASGGLVVNGSVVANTGEISLTGGSVTVGDYIYAGTDAMVTADNDITLYNIEADNNITVDSATGALAITEYVYAENGSVSLSGDNVTIEDSTITAGTNATVTADNNITLYEIEADNNITVDSVTGGVNIGGMVDASNGDVLLTGDNVTVDDYIDAGRNVRVESETGDLVLNGNVTGNTGGVSLTATSGRIYTDDGSNSLNVEITGYSDYADGGNNVAISIISGEVDEGLILGSSAVLTANGNYDSSAVDNRLVFELRDSGDHSGDPIDVALYLKSNGFIELESGTWIDSEGTVLMNASTKVISPDLFANVQTDRLEVVSRDTTRLQEAIDNARLPSADNVEAVETNIGGTYVLRGGIEEDGITGAWELYDDPIASTTEVAPIPAFITIAAVTPVQVAEEMPEMLTWLMEELGITERDLQARFADAFIYSTDVHQYVSIAKLKQAAEMLQDSGGTGFAALAEVINEFVNTSAPPSPEQFAAISQALSLHVSDGTNYASAGEMLDAFAEYVSVLTTEMGWSMENAVAVVLENYDSGESAIVTAMLMMHLNALGG